MKPEEFIFRLEQAAHHILVKILDSEVYVTQLGWITDKNGCGPVSSQSPVGGSQ